MFLRFSAARMSAAAGLIGCIVVDHNACAFRAPRLAVPQRSRRLHRRQDEFAPFEENLSKSTILANTTAHDLLHQEMAPKEELLAQVMESSMSETAISSIKSGYGEIVSALTQPDRLVDLAVSASRPRKAKVSFHSTLSAVATGCYLAVIIPIFSPGTFTNGFPRLYDEMLFDNVPLARMVLFLFAAVGATGVLRLPAQTPRLRRLLFEQGAWISLFCWVTGDSNYYIAAGHACTFDLLQMSPFFVYLCITAIMLVNSGKVIVEAISGTLKGRDSIIHGSSPLAVVLPQAIILFLFTFVFPMALFYRDDIGLFDTVYAPGIAASSGVQLTANLVVSGLISFGMFIATLLFEKRINSGQAQILFVLDIFTSGLYDSLVPIIDPDVFDKMGEVQLEQYIAQNDLVAKGYNEYHAPEFVLGLAAASIVVGLWKRSQKQLDAK